jgi:hypothetical protein
MQYLLWDFVQPGEWEDSFHQAWSHDTGTTLDVSPSGSTGASNNECRRVGSSRTWQRVSLSWCGVSQVLVSLPFDHVTPQVYYYGGYSQTRGGTRLVWDIVQEVFPPGRHYSEGAAKHAMRRRFPHLFS